MLKVVLVDLHCRVAHAREAGHQEREGGLGVVLHGLADVRNVGLERRVGDEREVVDGEGGGDVLLHEVLGGCDYGGRGDHDRDARALADEDGDAQRLVGALLIAQEALDVVLDEAQEGGVVRDVVALLLLLLLLANISETQRLMLPPNL